MKLSIKIYMFFPLIFWLSSLYGQKCFVESDRKTYQRCVQDLPAGMNNQSIYFRKCFPDIYETVCENGVVKINLLKKGGWSGWYEVNNKDNFIIISEKKDIKYLKKELKSRAFYKGNLNGKMNKKLWVAIRQFMLVYDNELDDYNQNLIFGIFYPKTLISKKAYQYLVNPLIDKTKTY